MARILFSVVSLLCVFQVMAAPASSRAVISDPACNQAVGSAGGSLLTTSDFLAGINTNSSADLTDPKPVLDAQIRALFIIPQELKTCLQTAQIALAKASTVSNLFAASLLDGKAPADTDSSAVILSNLLTAQKALNRVFPPDALNNKTMQTLISANSFLAQAVVSAQRLVNLNCTSVAGA
ncbi:hypothetical protein DFH06DRAFT_1472313 [Mycena polygramma]|nr:hypothetical protein DFH06DRAFT_1472313 [Mycena polygramma]